jgi:hypothetical protein
MVVERWRWREKERSKHLPSSSFSMTLIWVAANNEG